MARQRRDAVRNRQTLTVAAAEIFSEHGAEASLDLVAKRARLGRGTLYRHFTDRGALLADLIEQRIELLDSFASQHHDDDLLEQLIVEICGLLRDVPGLMAVARRFESAREEIDRVTERTGRLLHMALVRGQRNGTLRTELTLEDIYAVIAMVDGAILQEGDSAVPGLVERAINLSLRSLRTASALDRPVPRRSFAFPLPAGSDDDDGSGSSED